MRYLVIICFLLLTTCDGQTRERRQARGDDFVSDPDHLYFKNVRSRDYRAVTLAEGVDAYYHDELADPEQLVIVDRWLEDRAELLYDNSVVTPTAARELTEALRREQPDNEAAREVIADYLRLTGQ
jgi:hypothetical protein